MHNSYLHYPLPALLRTLSYHPHSILSLSTLASLAASPSPPDRPGRGEGLAARLSLAYLQITSAILSPSPTAFLFHSSYSRQPRSQTPFHHPQVRSWGVGLGARARISPITIIAGCRYCKMVPIMGFVLLEFVNFTKHCHFSYVFKIVIIFFYGYL